MLLVHARYKKVICTVWNEAEHAAASARELNGLLLYLLELALQHLLHRSQATNSPFLFFDAARHHGPRRALVRFRIPFLLPDVEHVDQARPGFGIQPDRQHAGKEAVEEEHLGVLEDPVDVQAVERESSDTRRAQPFHDALPGSSLRDGHFYCICNIALRSSSRL